MADQDGKEIQQLIKKHIDSHTPPIVTVTYKLWPGVTPAAKFTSNTPVSVDISFGFLQEDENFHSHNEFMRVSDLQKGQRAYCMLLTLVGNDQSPPKSLSCPMQSPATLATATAGTSRRIQSIDFIRGIIMVIMALDHTRDFFHLSTTGNPLDPATSYPALYFTRWITHFCAPTFVFLSGLSAWLQGQRKSKRELRRFLITRGLWLILFDLTVQSFIMLGDIHFQLFLLETLSSIGAGMAILGVLIALPYRYILAIGLVIVFGHNALDFLEASAKGPLPAWYKLLHQPGAVPLWGNHLLFILYPWLPWTGLTLLGYCCGRVFTSREFPQRKKILVRSGIAVILFFFILRAINLYGDPGPWQMQKSAMRTFFSFMNVSKYPPSLLYLCATIGPLLIFLGLAKNSDSRWQKTISIFGRVPLFYFSIHFLILHVACAIVFFLRGHTWAEAVKGYPDEAFKFVVPGEGFSLAGVYGIWIALVVLMYPLSKAYDRYKTANKDKWWLSYL